MSLFPRRPALADARWKKNYHLVLEVENCSLVVIPLPDRTTPATTAIMTAAMEPIQNDFMIFSLPSLLPG